MNGGEELVNWSECLHPLSVTPPGEGWSCFTEEETEMGWLVDRIRARRPGKRCL